MCYGYDMHKCVQTPKQGKDKFNLDTIDQKF